MQFRFPKHAGRAVSFCTGAEREQAPPVLERAAGGEETGEGLKKKAHQEDEEADPETVTPTMCAPGLLPLDASSVTAPMGQAVEPRAAR